MITHTTYECEICGAKFDLEAEARECEASGFPEPMPFLEWDCPIPTFGEEGVRYANLKSVTITRPYSAHEWDVETTSATPSAVSDFTYLPGHLFDPRRGWDIFRKHGSRFDLQLWEETLRRYGFTEADLNSYTRVSIDLLRRRFRAEDLTAERRRAVLEGPPPPTFIEHQALIPADRLIRKTAAPAEIG